VGGFGLMDARQQRSDRDIRVAGRWLGIVLSFRSDESMAGFDRGEFVLADPPPQHFLPSGIRIETPGTVLRDERDRERPVLRADVENGMAIGLRDEAMHLLIFLRKPLALEFVQSFVASADEILFSAEDCRDGLLVLLFYGEVEGVSGCFCR